MKRKLVKCAPRAYSELIKSDIPGSSGVRPARLHFLRSSPLFVMKRPVPKSSSSSVPDPLTAKLTRGELRSRLEVLAKKKRSMKWKPSSLPEGCPPTWGKTPKVGASPLPLSAVRAGDSSGKAGEPPLEVLPISVWSPTSRGVAPPSPSCATLTSEGWVGALPVEEALALLLQGIASVRLSDFFNLFLYCFSSVS